MTLLAFSKGLLISVLPLELPSFASVQFDSRVLLFTIAVLGFTLLTVTLVPSVAALAAGPAIGADDRR